MNKLGKRVSAIMSALVVGSVVKTKYCQAVYVGRKEPLPGFAPLHYLAPIREDGSVSNAEVETGDMLILGEVTPTGEVVEISRNSEETPAERLRILEIAYGEVD